MKTKRKTIRVAINADIITFREISLKISDE